MIEQYEQKQVGNSFITDVYGNPLEVGEVSWQITVKDRAGRNVWKKFSSKNNSFVLDAYMRIHIFKYEHEADEYLATKQTQPILEF